LSKLPTWAIIFANVTNNWLLFTGILCSSLMDACLLPDGV
jgi:hypothetical protein